MNSTYLDIVNIFPELRMQSWKFPQNWGLLGVRLCLNTLFFFHQFDLKFEKPVVFDQVMYVSMICVPVSHAGNVIKASRMQFVL